MPRPIHIAALQLRAHERADFVRLLAEILARVSEASSGADLVVLPEATFPAYVLGSASRHDDAAVNDAVDCLRELAARTHTVIVAGAAVRNGGLLRNGAIVIDQDGSIAGRSDKLFLWHFDRRWFEAGEHLAPVETSLGRLGVLVCADGRIPTIASALVDRGAQMLVMPTAWVTSGRDPLHLENVQADLLARVRAYENGVPFVAANKCGAELGMVAYCGKSQIVDSHGEVLAIAGERDPEILEATVTIGRERRRRATPTSPSPRSMTAQTPLRIAISFDPLPADVDDRLDVLDDAHAIALGNDERFAMLDGAVPTAFVEDDEILDPAVLVGYRRNGYRLVVWTARAAPPWIESIARARALELRLYVVVFDCSARRAFAVDPDGAIVAGTFDEYRLASFSFDPRKTIETFVAPGTDVAEAIERVAALVEQEALSKS